MSDETQIIGISKGELADLVAFIVKMTVNKMLTDLGMQSDIMTQSEIRKNLGRKALEKITSDNSVKWYPLYDIGRGRGNELYCSKEDFIKWLYANPI